MNATEQAAFLDGLKVRDEVRAVVDDRTLQILERRRRTATVHRRGWLVRRMLLAADVVGLVTAMLLVEWVVNVNRDAGAFDTPTETLLLVASVPGWIVAAKIYGLYDKDEERTDHSTTDDLAGVFHMITVCTWLFWAASYLTGLAHPTAPKLVSFWITAIAFVSIGRAAARSLSRRSIAYLQNTVIVGAGEVGQLVARKFMQHPEYGINLVGFVDDQPKERRDDLGHLALLGGIDRLPALVRMLDVERVIVAFSNESHEATLELIREMKDFDVQIDIVPRLFETIGPNFGLHMIEGLPLVGLPPLRLSRSSALLKRAMDVVLSGCALVIFAPAMLLIALVVKADSRGPALYRHERVGRGRKRVAVMKFRTMHSGACRGARYGGEAAEAAFDALMADSVRSREFEETYKLRDDPRVTRVGRFLRKTSLDELPQLLNVLTGDLSLVGPRAITVDELPRYGKHVDDLLGVRPGITGYWQVNGRSRLSYEDRVRLDLSYVTGWSLRLDLAILARTMRAIWSRSGAV